MWNRSSLFSLLRVLSPSLTCQQVEVQLKLLRLGEASQLLGYWPRKKQRRGKQLQAHSARGGFCTGPSFKELGALSKPEQLCLQGTILTCGICWLANFCFWMVDLADALVSSHLDHWIFSFHRPYQQAGWRRYQAQQACSGVLAPWGWNPHVAKSEIRDSLTLSRLYAM